MQFYCNETGEKAAFNKQQVYKHSISAGGDRKYFFQFVSKAPSKISDEFFFSRVFFVSMSILLQVSSEVITIKIQI